MKKKLLSIAAVLAVSGMAFAQGVADILTAEKGYQKITEMPANLDDYYFVIVEHTKQLMISLEQGTNQQNKTWIYRTPVDPATDLKKVWMIESNNNVNNASGYAFRNVQENSKLMQTDNNAGYYFRHNDQASPCGWTQFLFDYTEDGYWTFENGKYPMSSSAGYKGYVGTWSDDPASIGDGSEVAGNKAGENIGQYDLYAILKTSFWDDYLAQNENTFDANVLIVNREFSVANGLGTWSSNTQSKNNGRNTKTGGVFNNTIVYENWNPDPFSGSMSQTIKGLPNGKYELKAAAWREGGTGEVYLFANNDQTSVTTALDGTLNYTVATNVTDHSLIIGLESVNGGCNFMGLGMVTLSYLGAVDVSELTAAFNELKTALTALKGTTSGIDSYIEGALSGYETAPTTESELEAAISALTNAKAVAETILGEYSEFKTLVDNCQNFYNSSDDNSPSESVSTFASAISTAKTAADAVANVGGYADIIETLEAARLTYSVTVVPNDDATLDFTFYVVNPNFDTKDLTGWQSNTGAGNNQYQSGKNGELSGYYENWSGSAYTGEMYQNINNLPAGVYKLRAAAFRDQQVLDEGEQAHEENAVYLFANDKSTLVNSATGAYYEVADVVVADGMLKIGLKSVLAEYRWMGIDNVSLTYERVATDAELVEVLKSKLQTIIDEAETLNDGVNVGSAAFQIPTTAKTALESDITAAETLLASSSITSADLKSHISNLENAMEAYQNVEFNRPAAGDLFKIVMNATGNEEIDQHAITFVYNETADGNYNLQWLYENNANFAQALTISPVDGKKNTYTLSFVNAEGKTIYIGTEASGGYGDRNDRIRASENPDAAVELEMTYISEGVCHLKNIRHGQNLGSTGDKGVFTSNTACDLTIVKAEKATVELAANAGWATLALPFAAEIPAGLKVYTAADVNNTVIELTEESTLKANTPYIVNVTAEQKVSFSGWGLASSATCTSGLLTGVFANTAAPVGSYVLQNQPDVAGVAFYNVVADAQPTVTANHAYLTLSAAGANVRALLLPGSDATGIETVEAADATVDVYSISGVLVRSGVKKSEALNGLAKGIYIVGGVKRTVK